MLFFHVDDHYESWFDTTNLVRCAMSSTSTRLVQGQSRTYDSFRNDRSTFAMDTENPSVAEPDWTKARSCTSCARCRSRSGNIRLRSLLSPRSKSRLDSSRATRAHHGSGRRLRRADAQADDQVEGPVFRRMARPKCGWPTTARARCLRLKSKLPVRDVVSRAQ